MEENTVEGEVWINERKTNAKLFPYVSERGFSLKNESRGFSGPHTILNISPDKFTEIMEQAASNKSAVIPMCGEGLGSISENSGYDSADLGSFSREITSYTIKILHKLDCTQFILEGETDFLNPDTVREPYKANLKSRGRYSFKIWFNILDGNISAHFKNKIYVDAMTNYIGRCNC